MSSLRAADDKNESQLGGGTLTGRCAPVRVSYYWIFHPYLAGLWKISNRFWNLKQAYNVRMGISSENDVLPERIYGLLRPGKPPQEGKRFSSTCGRSTTKGASGTRTKFSGKKNPFPWACKKQPRKSAPPEAEQDKPEYVSNRKKPRPPHRGVFFLDAARPLKIPIPAHPQGRGPFDYFLAGIFPVNSSAIHSAPTAQA